MIRNRAVPAFAAAGALLFPASALAHAGVSPPIVEQSQFQLFALTVPTEKEGTTTTSVELTVPRGFSFGSFEPTPGWKRTVQAEGSGEDRVVKRVTWSGGSVPEGEAAVFRFTGGPDSAKKYAFPVVQTYSDGSVAEWTGPEDADEPAPVVEAVSSLGEGGGSSTLSIIALIVAGAAAALAVVAIVARRRSLT